MYNVVLFLKKYSDVNLTTDILIALECFFQFIILTYDKQTDVITMLAKKNNFKIQNVLVSIQRVLLRWKVVNRYKLSTSYA